MIFSAISRGSEFSYFIGDELQQLRNSYIKIYVPTKQKLISCLQTPQWEISVEKIIQLLTFAAIVIFYPVFATFDLMGRVMMWAGKSYISQHFKNCYRAKLEGRDLGRTIQGLEKKQASSWQEQAMKLVHQNRKSDRYEEIFRLNGAGLLTLSEIICFYIVFKFIQIRNLENRKIQDVQSQALAVLGQTMAVRKIYGSTHHVFTHAQSTQWLVFSVAMKMLMKKLNPEEKLSFYKFLRAPKNKEEVESIEKSFLGYLSSFFRNSFLGKFFSSNTPTRRQEGVVHETVQDYLKTLPKINDSDMTIRENLLSVDAYPYNFQAFESVIDFLVSNDNILSSKQGDIVVYLIDKILKGYNVDANHSWKISQKIVKISKKYLTNPLCGNAFAICFPKGMSGHSHYRAHPFGVPCECHSPKEDDKILGKLQRGTLWGLFNGSVLCTKHIPIPQYRLYTPHLKRAKIFRFAPFPRQQMRALKEELNGVIKEIPIKPRKG